MRYVAAALLLAQAGEEVNAANIEKVLSSVGVEVDKKNLDIVLKNIAGKSLDDLLAEGTPKLAAVGGGGAAAAPAAGGAAAADAPAAAKKEEKAEIGRAHVELQSRSDLVCRLLLEKKKYKNKKNKKNSFNMSSCKILATTQPK